MIEKQSRKEPFILSIGGGKGGVGKSMISSNLAVHYASAGLRVVIIDLDIGAANLHTILGIRQPPRGLGEYFTKPGSILSDYLIETKIPNLSLIPGSGFVPELANLKHPQKIKIINQIKTLDADLVLLDLGAGTAINVVDFFSMTHTGIIVTTPEPTAVINAYEFLKNVVYRLLFRMFRNQEKILELIKTSAKPKNSLNVGTVAELIALIEQKNSWAAENIRDVCADLNIHVIFNQARRYSEAGIANKLNDICKKHLEISLNFPGMVFFNEEVPTSVIKMSPVSVAYPDSVTSLTLKRLSFSILEQIIYKEQEGSNRYTFETQYAKAYAHAKQDYAANYLAQKRLTSEERVSATKEITQSELIKI